MSLKATEVNTELIGYFRVFATPPGGERREITMLRGAPISVDSFSTADPFTETTASLSCPQITMFDTPGQGDLDWLVPDSDIDIEWFNYGGYDYEYTWEGFIVSYDCSMGGTSTEFRIDLKGALFALDNFMAKPTFPRKPIPYEILIQQAFDQQRNPARLKKLKILFPDEWNRVVPEYGGPDKYKKTLKPSGVIPGQKWTGLVARNTGSWEPMLSGFVQSLLTVMFDDGGSQWTIRNTGKRRPVMSLRKIANREDDNVLIVTLGAPGVTVEASRDFSQRANIVYGQGKDDAGVTYSGMTVAGNGSNTFFKPYAWSPLVYPGHNNPALASTVQPKETIIRFVDGLDEVAAQRVANAQLQRFADPGVTGSITLQTDPVTNNGTPYPRFLIQAGTPVLIKGIYGISEGLLVHTTQTTADINGLTMSLTFDSKYRDVLTVAEVQARTRDALSPLRALQVGKFSNTLQDLLFPWNYREGSGILPSGGPFSAKEFFTEKVPTGAVFPYEEWTQKYPPKKYPNYYVKIGPTDTENASNNWSGAKRNGTQVLAHPIRMAQAGTIRLSQIAAYDKNGNVLPVRFHVSVYRNNGVGPSAMPEFHEDPTDVNWLKPVGITTNYTIGNSHPFIENGWEQVKDDGTIYDSDSDIPRGNSDLVVGWGNYYEPAGYSPGRFSRGSSRTGLLTDATEWTWDLTEDFDKRDASPLEQDAGHLFLEIYCDEQGDEPVFFMGRFFRTEPGTQ